MPPQRRSRICSADRGAGLPTMVGASGTTPEQEDMPVLGRAAQAPVPADVRSTPPGVAPEPLRDPLTAGRTAPATQDDPVPPAVVVIPDAGDVPPARHPVNVRWVKTASGTSLPLRPAPNDE